MQSIEKQNGSRNTLIFCISFVFAIVTYHFIFGGFFPNRNMALGHDYAYFFSSLLSGYYWFKENGLFDIPWFTPAFCGGVPYFPNPQVMYYSVPQFLTFIIDPLSSVYLTFILFASIGYLGFYRLSTDIFRLTPMLAVYGAMLFLFNGFYAYRMVIGHLTYHAFMLIPFIACLLLQLRSDKKKRMGNEIISILITGVLIAYFIHSGAANFIVPATLTIIGIWALSGLNNGVGFLFWPRLLGALFIGFLLSISKVISGILFLSHFPRDLYPLPGIEGVGDVLLMFYKSLFLSTPNITNVANTGILFQQHAFEFGITIIPLIIIVIFTIKTGIKYFKKEKRLTENCEKTFLLTGFVLIMILVLPVAINYYSPVWNTFLKGLPYIKNSSSLFRWMAIEIPLIILISSIALTKLSLKSETTLIVMLVVSVVAINIISNKEYYHHQPYHPDNILHAYKRAKTSQTPNTVEYIAVNEELEAEGTIPLWRNDLIAVGASQLYCYEPIFGYRLESFPIGSLRPGEALATLGNELNLKNPACYLYGSQNTCQPGGHFSAEQIDHAKAFLSYRPFDFNIPLVQRVANVVNQLTVILIVFVFGFYGIRSIKDKIGYSRGD